MNIITIDPSLISTSITINGIIYNFVEKKRVFNKKGMSKWFDLCKNNIEYIYINEYVKDYKNYQNSELHKLKDYNKVTDIIINTILDKIDVNQETVVAIESYSYGSSNGDIIDLVTFSTLLRTKIYFNITQDLRIIPPKSLKLLSAQLTYEPEITGVKVKKYKYKNNEGVSGGNFTKKEIYRSLIENADQDICDMEYISFLKKYRNDLIDLKNIPKPLDDSNDAFMLYCLVLKKLI